jgi:hypothetical protein
LRFARRTLKAEIGSEMISVEQSLIYAGSLPASDIDLVIARSFEEMVLHTSSGAEDA